MHRLAFIFYFIVPVCFGQSVEFQELYEIFNSAQEDAAAVLHQKGFSLLPLNSKGRISGDAVIYSAVTAGWINEKKERILWEYRRSSPQANVGLSQPDGFELLSEAVLFDPKLDTAAMLAGIRKMGLQKFQTRTADLVFTNDERSFFVGFMPPTTTRYQSIYFVRKGDMHYHLLMRLYGNLNRVQKTGAR